MIVLFVAVYAALGFFVAGTASDGGSTPDDLVFLLGVMWPLTVIMFVLWQFFRLGAKTQKRFLS